MMIKNILVVVENFNGQLTHHSLETLVAAQSLNSQQLNVLILGDQIMLAAEELATLKVNHVYLLENNLLRRYTADGYSTAVEQVIENTLPELVFFPHSYQTRDYAPKLSARLNCALVTDCIGFLEENGKIKFIRPLFQGRFNSHVEIKRDSLALVTLQLGIYSADDLIKGNGKANILKIEIQLSNNDIRQQTEEPIHQVSKFVDLNKAEIIIAVGRGIKSSENIGMIRKLASLLGAEIAATRPVCDEGWLTIDHQVGSSGQTVAPKIYFTIGISGAIQHLVGMKGSKTIVAINKDPDAPIFKIADYGIVGDLFQIIPELIDQLEEIKNG